MGLWYCPACKSSQPFANTCRRCGRKIKPLVTSGEYPQGGAWVRAEPKKRGEKQR